MTQRKCQFGGRVTRALAARYARSPHWNGKKFVNLEETSTALSFQSLPGFLRKQLCEKVDREPVESLAMLPFSSEEFLREGEGWSFVWFGHSVLLLRLAGATVLVDPMFGPNAAPISPVAVRRYSEDTLRLIDALPNIDVVLLTHDHYDHLDYESIRRLKSRVGQFLTPLGVGRHLVAWGIGEEKVSELDWWQETSLGRLRLTLTPSRHFSGRGLTDRAKSLWGGWVLATEDVRIWLSGDGGYGAHLKEIGRRLGPFDIAFTECGQYNEAWRALHMFPEESVLAAVEARAARVVPVHWGAFSLAQHSWREPVERFLTEAERLELPCMVPRLGQLVRVSEEFEPVMWWRATPPRPEPGKIGLTPGNSA